MRKENTMKQRLIELLSNMKKYNRGIMSKEIYGLEPEVCYDALVVAPGWKPTKIIFRKDSSAHTSR